MKPALLLLSLALAGCTTTQPAQHASPDAPAVHRPAHRVSYPHPR